MELLRTLTSLYNDINPATLSGAVDVVVVEQPDGTLRSSPFHVRFGKLTLMRAKERQVGFLLLCCCGGVCCCVCFVDVISCFLDW